MVIFLPFYLRLTTRLIQPPHIKPQFYKWKPTNVITNFLLALNSFDFFNILQSDDPI